MTQKERASIGVPYSTYILLQKLAGLYAEELGERVSVPKLIRLMTEAQLEARKHS